MDNANGVNAENMYSQWAQSYDIASRCEYVTIYMNLHFIRTIPKDTTYKQLRFFYTMAYKPLCFYTMKSAHTHVCDITNQQFHIL